MANKEHLEILRQGTKVWNHWREENPDIRPDLTELQLSGVKLNWINFIGTNLARADLTGSSLIWANMAGASLLNARFEGALLFGARLSGVLGRELNLRSADLRAVDFTWAYLADADFTDAVLQDTIFGAVDLRRTKGLERVVHAGPSVIDVNTVYRSEGLVSDKFLRGAGIPETLIAYMHSLVGQPIKFFSCFISYSAKDQLFVERLHADLQAQGVRTWYFPDDAKWGESVWGEIDRGIKLHDKLILVCSKDSLESAPVLRELDRALNSEAPGRKETLFPIRIDDYVVNGWDHQRKSDVLRKVIGDFEDWGTDVTKYNKSIKRLVAALMVV